MFSSGNSGCNLWFGSSIISLMRLSHVLWRLTSKVRSSEWKRASAFNIRFGWKYDSHGTSSLNLFDVLAQIIGDCITKHRGYIFENRSDTSTVKTYHFTDRHFSAFQLL